MLMFFYDTETTGLPLFDQPSDDPQQPHIVQAAGALVNRDTGKIIASIDLIARPDGWTIPHDVAEIHGITTSDAEAVGVPESLIVSLMYDLWRRADVRVGHNESFDARIMRIGLKRFIGEDASETWKGANAECTARLSTKLLNLPPTDKMLAAGRRHPKTPKLEEAYEFFTGRKLEDAHSAMADVLGCMEVWFAINHGQAAAGSAAARALTIAESGGEAFEKAKLAGRAAAQKQVKMPPTADADDGIAFL